jgi:hypothetical protein
VLPLPEPAKKPADETFLGDLARAGALPGALDLAGAADGAAVVLPGGARARLERVPARVPPAGRPEWLVGAPAATVTARTATAASSALRRGDATVRRSSRRARARPGS